MTRTEKMRGYRKKHHQKKRAWLDAIKGVPCADCGGSFPPECMDFDHLRGKKYEIGGNSSRSFESLTVEISKCDIICANCYRIRTKHRKGA